MKRRILCLAAALACGGDASNPSDGGADATSPDGQPPIDSSIPLDGTAPPGKACAPLAAPTGTIVTVTPADIATLPTIVTSATSGTTIVLANGTYTLPSTLQMYKPGVTLRSQSNDATKVILDANYVVDEGIAIAANDVTVAHITVTRAVNHPIHAYTQGSDVTGIRLYGLRFIDGGEQFLKVNSSDQTHFVDKGTVECSTFQMTDAGRPNVERNPGGCYTGGIDVHGGRDWVVRNNRFQDIYCAGEGLAEHAIHFWTGSRDTLTENNLIIDCARGVGYGLGTGGGRIYTPDPFPGVTPIGHFGGVIRNNIIWATTKWFDTGIELQQARGTKVLHNTVVSNTGTGSLFFSSIDYRFANTDVTIIDNLTNRITVRDGANGTVSNNVESTPLSFFVDTSTFDFHLTASAASAIDKGIVDTDSGFDIDGEKHDIGAPDIGADERKP